jgi:formylglycine-generating enzyme required for sulfatase activity
MTFRIDAYLIDPEAYEIRRDGTLVPVEPQVFDLLVMLVENRHRAVTKDEIIEQIWKRRIVSDATLSSRIKSVRQILGDDGSAQRLIRTIHGRGFRFVGEVTQADPTADAEPVETVSIEQPDDVATTKSNETVVASQAADTAGQPTDSRTEAFVAVVLAALVVSGFLVDRLLSHAALPGSNSQLAHTTPTQSDQAPGPTEQKTAAFKDCDICPEMVELPTGTFMMGSPEHERGHQRVEEQLRKITIAKRVAIGKFEVTVDQFETFVAETGSAIGNKCSMFDTQLSQWGKAEASFRQPGFRVTGSHPVVCVSWHEAQAYTTWLARRTGKPYRLPSEVEWEYAARAGSTTSYSFGIDEGQLCDHARFADLGSPFPWRGGCRSDQATLGSVPVGTLKPNAWGLFDMHGNAWEWAADCWTPDAQELPADASNFTRAGACEVGVVRGGGWAAQYNRVRSAQRLPLITVSRFYHIGFRVALSLDPL